MKQNKLFKLLFIFLLLNISHATTLKQAVEYALVNNPEVMSLQKNSEAYRLYIDEEEGAYYPSINLDTYLEKKDELKEPKDDDKTKSKQSGYNAQLKLEQMIYDGGLTPAKVDEAKYNYQETKIKNISTIENIIFEVTQAYLDLVKYKELLVLSENNIAIHDSYLETAKQSEEVSGETLDRIQVESKLFLATSKLFQQKDDKEVSLHSFKKLVGHEPSGDICKPIINPTLVPNDIKKAISQSVRNSFSVLSQIEMIKAQRAIVSQEQSRFLPTLTFELKEEWDDDLDTAKTKTTTKSAKLKLSYNIFNGNKDKVTQQREKIFLQESQKVLDDTVNIVEQEIKTSYSNYLNSLNKITYLKLYSEKTQEILDVYKEQFLGGTRTFIDILNSEAEVFSAKTQLIEEEYSLMSSYYEILLVLSKLSDTIVMQDNQICKAMLVDTSPNPLDIDGSDSSRQNTDDADFSEIADLLEEDVSADTTADTQMTSLSNTDKTLDLDIDTIQKTETQQEKLVKDLVSDILNDVYELNEIETKELINERIVDERLIEEEANKILVKPVAIKKEPIEPKKEIKKQIQKSQTIGKTKQIKITQNNNEKLIEPESNLSKKDEKILKEVINETPKKTINEKKLDKILKQKTVKKEIKPFKIRFLNSNDSNYTLNLKTFSSMLDANQYVKENKVLTDVFVYKFGKNLEFVKLINGIYYSYKDAKNELGNIQKQIDTDEFIIDSIGHQKDLYKKFNIGYQKPTKNQTTVHKAKPKETKTIEVQKNSNKAPIDLEDIDNSMMAKINFLTAKEDDYVLNVSSFNSIDELYTFMEDNLLGNKAFAFRFGKNQELIKLLYGVYETRILAQDDYNKINKIKSINPILEKISKYHNLYAQHQNIESETKTTLNILGIKNIDALRPKASKIEESKKEVLKNNAPTVKLSKTKIKVDHVADIKKETTLKITSKTNKKLTKTEVEIEQIKKEIEALEKEIHSEKAKIRSNNVTNEVKTQSLLPIQSVEEKIKKIKMIDEEIKIKEQSKTHASNQRNKMKGIVFIDNKSKSTRSLPLEFVTKRSQYYTIMILDFKSRNEAQGYVQRYRLNDNTIIFNYASKYKVIHGAYKTFNEASKAIKSLHSFVRKTKPYVRKVSGYQDLYKKYHQNIGTSSKSESIKVKNKKTSIKNKKLTGIYFANSKLKKEFLNTNSRSFTITLTTSPNIKEAKWFRYKHKVQSNTIVYTFRKQVKIIYGIYKSSREANRVIAGFSKELKRYKPFVNRISTHQKLYEKYN